MATTLHVVRHGETDWNRDRRVQGHTDIPLNDEGRRQARVVAAQLAVTSFEAAYASDLTRAFETATIIVGTRPLSIASCPSLREKHFGTWEGLTDAEVRERFPHSVNGAWGDGESAEEMSARVVDAVVQIATSHDGCNVLVVAHGGPIRALHRWAGDEPPYIANCAVTAFTFSEGRFRPV